MTSAVGHKYRALDALRGVAAISITLGHLQLLDGFPNFFSSYLAVDLFFALSGFVIARAYQPRLADGLGAKRFMLLRAIRLWPLTLLGILLAAVQTISFLGLGSEFDGVLDVGMVAVLNGLFIPAIPTRSTLFPINPPIWSLFYELLINLVYASGLWKLPARGVGWMLLVAGLCEMLVCVRYNGMSLGFRAPQFPFAMVRVTFSFFLGVFMHQSRANWMARIPDLDWRWLALTTVLLLSVPHLGPGQMLYDAAFVFLFSPMLIMMGARSVQHTGARSTAIWLGEISFPLYALHYPFITAMEIITSGRPILHLWMGISLTIMLVLLMRPVAILYDEPVRRWLERAIRVS
ncbi:MAG TPA: acyltransferase [Sphingobium sp.]